MNGLQSFAIFKSLLANDNYTVRNHTEASSGNQLVGRGLYQCMAVISGIIYRISDFHSHFFQLIVSLKHFVPNRCHALGYSNVLKFVAIIESTGSYRLEVRGKGDRYKFRTIDEFTAS